MKYDLLMKQTIHWGWITKECIEEIIRNRLAHPMFFNDIHKYNPVNKMKNRRKSESKEEYTVVEQDLISRVYHSFENISIKDS